MAAPAVPANAHVAAAIEEAQSRFTDDNPASLAQHQAAAASMPGGNTRTVLHYPPYPLTLARGNGCRLWDIDGHEYIDFLGEYTAGLYGHSNPLIRAAIDNALDGGVVLGGQIEAEAKLAAALVARFPSLEMVRFTNSGTEANLMAISAARAFTGRSKVMVMEGGYHGGILYFAPGGSPLNAPFDYVMGRFNDAEHCTDLIRQHGDELACVLVEPMQGAGGVLPGEQSFLESLRSETSAAGCLLIFDEVMTSRLSAGGLQALTGVTPDMTSLGKYVGGGMSFGAFGGRDEIMAHFDPRRDDAWPHAGTFNNNALTMNAGQVGLNDVYTPEVAETFNARGDRLRERLNAIADKHGVPMQFTGRGSMIGSHFQRGDIRNIDDALKGRHDLRPLLHMDLLAAGIYPAARGMFTLMLPHGDAEFDALCEAMDEFMASRASLLTGPA
jgi:glutamate-1-semialdehyde 2,1-aminomutase